MKLTRLSGCAGSSCPTLYATDRDTIVVQGYVVQDLEALESLDLPTGEAVVEVPRHLLEGLDK